MKESTFKEPISPNLNAPLSVLFQRIKAALLYACSNCHGKLNCWLEDRTVHLARLASNRNAFGDHVNFSTAILSPNISQTLFQLAVQHNLQSIPKQIQNRWHHLLRAIHHEHLQTRCLAFTLSALYAVSGAIPCPLRTPHNLCRWMHSYINLSGPIWLASFWVFLT